MKSMFKGTLASLAALAILAPTAALADGPEVFKAQKCNSCHSVKAAGIAIAAGADADKDAPDLSKVGASLDKKGIALFVLKKSEIKGVKHKKAYAGSNEDLKTVAEWLAGLK